MTADKEAGGFKYSPDVEEYLEALRQDDPTVNRMLTPQELELSKKLAKEAGARARAIFEASKRDERE